MFHPKVIYSNPNDDRSESPIRYISHRVLKNNKNFLCAVTGPTGSGKTYTMGAIGEMYSKATGIPFNAKDHIVFTFSEFLELIRNGEKDGRLQVGSFIGFDEPQVSINSRSWQSQANQSFNSLVSTFRHRRLVVFFATPFLEFLDIQTRVLFHAEFEMKSIDKTRNVAIIRPMFIEYYSKLDKWYRKFLDVIYKVEGKSRSFSYDLRLWEVPKPSQAWIDIYEPKKKAFTDKLNENLQRKLQKVEEKELQSASGTQKSNVFDSVRELYPEYDGNLLEIYDKIREKHGNVVSLPTISNYITLLKKQYLTHVVITAT